MSEIEKLQRTYEVLLEEQGVLGAHFYLGDLKGATVEDFAAEANIVAKAYLDGNTSPVKFNDSYGVTDIDLTTVRL